MSPSAPPPLPEIMLNKSLELGQFCSPETNIAQDGVRGRLNSITSDSFVVIIKLPAKGKNSQLFLSTILAL